MLVDKAYGRAWWFRLVREPLRLGMVAWGRACGIDPELYAMGSAWCAGCVRSLKTALKDASPLFRKVNGVLNPVFDRLLERVVTGGEIMEAKDLAREMSVVCRDCEDV